MREGVVLISMRRRHNNGLHPARISIAFIVNLAVARLNARGLIRALCFFHFVGRLIW